MKNDFIIKCPYCGKDNDFNDDNWLDELIDTSDHTYTDCMYCDYPMEIITHATYTFEVEMS